MNNIKYIEDIRKNVEDVSYNAFSRVFKDVKEADCCVILGDGRSRKALGIVGSELAKMKHKRKKVLSIEDSGFPRINSAPEELSKEYENLLVIVNSGSGESKSPYKIAKIFADYRDETGATIKIDACTSKPNSSIGNLAKKYGTVLKLKGRTKHEAESRKGFGETGISGDIYEIGSMFPFQAIAEGIYYDMSKSEAYRQMKSKIAEMPLIVKDAIDSEPYRVMIDSMKSRNYAYIGGFGTDKEVAEMTAIRWEHIKVALGDAVYLTGDGMDPSPRKNDLGIFISCMGDTDPVKEWCNKFRKNRAKVVSIIGKKDSPQAKASDYNLYIRNNKEVDGPRDFYVNASVALSPLPIMVCIELEKNGTPLPESLLKSVHSITS